MSNNKEYWEKRIDNIKDAVSIRNLIDYFNVECQSSGTITQVHCPFHGHDNHASARIYETNTMYCWVCSKNWDVIEFIRDFKQITFQEACKILEEMYGIEKPSREEFYQKEESLEDFLEFEEIKKENKEKNFDDDFKKINKTLIRNRDSFSLEDYRDTFYFYDKLYYLYKSGKYCSDLEIIQGLGNLQKEIAVKS
jgi:DNA primase